MFTFTTVHVPRAALFGLCAALVGSTGIASAADTIQRYVDRTVELGAATSLVVSGYAGDVHVTGTDAGQVSVHARLRAQTADDLGRMDARVTADGPTIHVASVFPRSPFSFRRRDESIDYEIAVPRNVRVSVELTAGDLVIAGLRGQLIAHDKFGDVRVTDATNDVEAGTKTGDVTVKLDPAWHGSALTLWTSVGDVSLSAPSRLRARLSARTRIGEVRGADWLGDPSAGPSISLASSIGDVRVSRI
jgi:hypothetical protein